jgi:hypothetical protein
MSTIRWLAQIAQAAYPTTSAVLGRRINGTNPAKKTNGKTTNECEISMLLMKSNPRAKSGKNAINGTTIK